jgi:hypothetical protein
MNASWKNGVALAVAAALVLLVVVLCWQPALAQRDGATTSPRYSVIDTEGHNLIVTDNQRNTVYFYTIEKDKTVGSDLKLRGSIDLTQVGKPTIRLTPAKNDK